MRIYAALYGTVRQFTALRRYHIAAAQFKLGSRWQYPLQ